MRLKGPGLKCFLTGQKGTGFLVRGLAGGILVLFLVLVSAPRRLFPERYSTLLVSSDGRLLGARTASDGQWRFPPPDTVPLRFEKCLLTFEDRHFYHHPGINPVSLARALVWNLRRGRIVSGGSTLTMQVARLARPGKKRSLLNKGVEMVWALNLELRYSKGEILRMYAAHAPFGGNTVGMEAAAQRYFQRPPHLLSWAESATLAVLPNAPALIFPGKNDALLLAKRNRLLETLFRRGVIDTLTLSLSLEEPLPGKVYPMPDLAPHLTALALKTETGHRVVTTLDFGLQEQVNAAVAAHARLLAANHVYNCAALVADVATGRVAAYTGNVPGRTEGAHGEQVDVIRAPRSSGSILKPFLYAAMTARGMVAPRQLIPDIPLRFEGFTPLNFSGSYDGAVPAAEALARSLNVPAVTMLRTYGVEPFHYFLRETGMTTLSKPPGHYGLSLVLGGAEATLWDLGGMYASLARTVTRYAEEDGFYPVQQFCPLVWKEEHTPCSREEAAAPVLPAAAAYLTLEALREVNRPGEETGWEAFAGTRQIAWKTGTSFGFRDGWAVGMTPRWMVAVWAGNGDGEGRPGLTGTLAAAPLMFEIFGMLPAGGWFPPPAGELTPVAFCRQSGFLPSPWCPDTDTLLVPGAISIGQCPYHTLLHLNREGDYQVSEDCYPVSEMRHASWFLLPPAMEHYYRRIHPGYHPAPPVKPGCGVPLQVMELIYPREMERLFIPRQLDGSPGTLLFEVAHRHPQTTLYWYVDRDFVGETRDFHQMSLYPSPGSHTLTITDADGYQLTKKFRVMRGEDGNFGNFGQQGKDSVQ